MTNYLSQNEESLAAYMSEISERCYAAGWMKNLEYVLWDAVVCGPKNYGYSNIDKNDIQELIKLSDQMEFWIIFDPEKAEIPI